MFEIHHATFHSNLSAGLSQNFKAPIKKAFGTMAADLNPGGCV